MSGRIITATCDVCGKVGQTTYRGIMCWFNVQFTQGDGFFEIRGLYGEADEDEPKGDADEANDCCSVECVLIAARKWMEAARIDWGLNEEDEAAIQILATRSRKPKKGAQGET